MSLHTGPDHHSSYDVDERTLCVAEVFGIDYERISWADWHRPVFAGRMYAGEAVHEKAMIKIEGLTDEEAQRFRRCVWNTPGLGISAFAE